MDKYTATYPKPTYKRQKAKVQKIGGEIMKKHGMSRTALYYSWLGMKHRCLHPKTINYKDYGGRGITICEKWLDFEGFYEDMHKTYKEGLTIDRIDNNGNYCPENCRWSTRAEQANNRNYNIKITYNNETHTALEWARIYGIRPGTFYGRIYLGWDIDDLFNRPIQKHKRKCVSKCS